MAKVAILGFGTVGSGVGEVLMNNASIIEKRAGEPVELKYILLRRELPGTPFENMVVHDFSVIEKDPEISVVAECIGGVGVAKDYTLRALRAGKSVVTPNKELVAAFGDQLFEIARERNVNYLYEGAVGGGVPIIRPLGNCLAANAVSEIFGILNGTTNYILTKMIQEGLSFDTALKQAQEKGYAEADPTADVEGHDACRKISILASLNCGRHISPETVPTVGITGITDRDVALAAAAGMKIKLLGRTVRDESGSVYAYVSPHLIPEGNLIAGVDDVFNAVVVRGNAVGEVLFYGPGAGKLPTASAVAADIVDAVRHQDQRQKLEWIPAGNFRLQDAGELPMRWFLRTSEPPEKVTAVFGNAELITDPAFPGEIALLTEAMGKKQLDEMCSEITVGNCLPVLA